MAPASRSWSFRPRALRNLPDRLRAANMYVGIPFCLRLRRRDSELFTLHGKTHHIIALRIALQAKQQTAVSEV